MVSNSDETGSTISIPTAGVMMGVVILIGFPFVSENISAETGMLRLILWGIAILIVVYMLMMFRRIRNEDGTMAAIKWLVTGRLPQT